METYKFLYLSGYSKQFPRFGGQCSMSDLKNICNTFNQVKENSDYFETQMLENYEAPDKKY